MLDDTGHTSESFGRKCVAPQVPRFGSANYEHLSYGHSHELCKRRGYQKMDAKAVLQTRSAAMVAVERRPPGGAANDMDTSSSVLGKRSRNIEKPLAIDTPEMGEDGNCTRGDALATALPVDIPVVQEHAQW